MRAVRETGPRPQLPPQLCVVSGAHRSHWMNREGGALAKIHEARKPADEPS